MAINKIISASGINQQSAVTRSQGGVTFRVDRTNDGMDARASGQLAGFADPYYPVWGASPVISSGGVTVFSTTGTYGALSELNIYAPGPTTAPVWVNINTNGPLYGASGVLIPILGAYDFEIDIPGPIRSIYASTQPTGVWTVSGVSLSGPQCINPNTI